MALTTRRRALTTFGAALAALTALPAADAFAAEGGLPVQPLWRAHAHNDYEHARPLLDALDHRFGSVEADVYLVDGQLLVAHDPVDLDPARTLDALYLAPLAARVAAQDGSVYQGDRTPFQLLVDIKTRGAAAYRELDRQLRAYGALFTTYDKGQVRRGPVTAVVSGDRAARTPLQAQKARSAFYDGRLTDLGTTDASFAPLISDNWTLHFRWSGVGAFPEAERTKLRTLVGTAHERGQRVRFWSTPDAPGPARDAVWGELLDAGVDHLNTDDLAGLEAFLDARSRTGRPA